LLPGLGLLSPQGWILESGGSTVAERSVQEKMLLDSSTWTEVNRTLGPAMIWTNHHQSLSPRVVGQFEDHEPLQRLHVNVIVHPSLQRNKTQGHLSTTLIQSKQRSIH